MPKLIKNGQLIDNPWTILEPGATPETDSPALVHVASWSESFTNQHTGIWLDSADSITQLPGKLENIPVIAVNFPVFADGRSFSIARQIRDQLEYKGELRAIGNFMQDQAFYLKRCGVDSFAVNDEADIESYKVTFNSFTDCYQAAVDEPRPLFRRR